MTLSRHLVRSFEISPVLLLNTLPNLQLCGSTFFAQHNKALDPLGLGMALFDFQWLSSTNDKDCINDLFVRNMCLDMRG